MCRLVEKTDTALEATTVFLKLPKPEAMEEEFALNANQDLSQAAFDSLQEGDRTEFPNPVIDLEEQPTSANADGANVFAVKEVPGKEYLDMRYGLQQLIYKNYSLPGYQDSG